MSDINEMNEFDDLNTKAYLNVLDCEEPDPLFIDNKTYMESYRFWRNHAGESHFDPHFDSDIDF
jgi:hypothetical protein